MTTRLEAIRQREQRATKDVIRAGERFLVLLLAVAEFVEYATTRPAEMQRIMREHGFVMDNMDEPWQKLAFTLYTELVELAERAKAALDVEEQS